LLNNPLPLPSPAEVQKFLGGEVERIEKEKEEKKAGASVGTYFMYVRMNVR